MTRTVTISTFPARSMPKISGTLALLLWWFERGKITERELSRLLGRFLAAAGLET